jgi:hypothetical protein
MDYKKAAVISDKIEIKNRVSLEDDFINSKKYSNSLSMYLKYHPEGATDNVIAHFLCVTPKEVEEIYNSAVKSYRQLMKVDVK